MAPIRRVVLDVLKPHDPSTIEFASAVADAAGVDGVNAVLVEVDSEVENVKLTIEGDRIEYDAVEEVVEDLGATVHSVDQVACGMELIEETGTPQD